MHGKVWPQRDRMSRFPLQVQQQLSLSPGRYKYSVIHLALAVKSPPEDSLQDTKVFHTVRKYCPRLPWGHIPAQGRIHNSLCLQCHSREPALLKTLTGVVAGFNLRNRFPQTSSLQRHLAALCSTWFLCGAVVGLWGLELTLLTSALLVLCSGLVAGTEPIIHQSFGCC